MTRAFVVGDSHSAALGPLLFEAGRSLGWEPVGRVSNVGWSTARYASEPAWKATLAAARPDLVIVVLGTNDAAQGQQVYAGQLRAVVDAVNASGAPSIVWVGPPSAKNPAIDARADRIAPWQGSFLPQMGVKWIDSRMWTFGGHAPDGVHFTRAGYRAWADALIDDMKGSAGTVARSGSSAAGSVIPWIVLAGAAAWLVSRYMGKGPRTSSISSGMKRNSAGGRRRTGTRAKLPSGSQFGVPPPVIGGLPYRGKWTLVGSRRLGIPTAKSDIDYMVPIESVRHSISEFRPYAGVEGAYWKSVPGSDPESTVVAIPRWAYDIIDESYAQAVERITPQQMRSLRKKLGKDGFYRAIGVAYTGETLALYDKKPKRRRTSRGSARQG